MSDQQVQRTSHCTDFFHASPPWTMSVSLGNTPTHGVIPDSFLSITTTPTCHLTTSWQHSFAKLCPSVPFFWPLLFGSHCLSLSLVHLTKAITTITCSCLTFSWCFHFHWALLNIQTDLPNTMNPMSLYNEAPGPSTRERLPDLPTPLHVLCPQHDGNCPPNLLQTFALGPAVPPGWKAFCRPHLHSFRNSWCLLLHEVLDNSSACGG